MKSIYILILCTDIEVSVFSPLDGWTARQRGFEVAKRFSDNYASCHVYESRPYPMELDKTTIRVRHKREDK